MKYWSGFLASLVAVFVLAAPAGAQPGPSGYGKVLGLRAEAGVALSSQIERARARQELETALTARGRALNDMIAAQAAARNGEAADWRPLAGGVGGAVGLILVALGVVVFVHRARHPVAESR